MTDSENIVVTLVIFWPHPPADSCIELSNLNAIRGAQVK